jgi:transketolase
VTCWWGQYGCVDALGVDGFGESAPAAAVYQHFELDAQHLADRVGTTLINPEDLLPCH